MKKLLEDLWYSYEMQSTVKQSEEEEALMELIVLHEEKLHASLNAEQLEQLKKYEDCVDGLHDIAEKVAFVKGVRFAAAFLTEALEVEK